MIAPSLGPSTTRRAPYIDALLRGIVGVEMRVERIEAKRKLSQNKSAVDFDGVVAGFAERRSAAARRSPR